MAIPVRDVYFHGHLADTFGPHLRLAVPNVVACLRLLDANFPGRVWPAFEDGEYEIVCGGLAGGLNLGLGDDLLLSLGPDELHFLPVTSGAKGGGSGKAVAKVILGVSLMAFGGIGAAGMIGGVAGSAGALSGGISLGTLGTISWGSIIFQGVTMVLTGVSAFFSPQAKGPNTTSDKPENQPSFFMDTPVNQMEQGGCVPLVVGKVRMGSVTVGGSLSVTDYPVGAAPPATSTLTEH